MVRVEKLEKIKMSKEDWFAARCKEIREILGGEGARVVQGVRKRKRRDEMGGNLKDVFRMSDQSRKGTCEKMIPVKRRKMEEGDKEISVRDKLWGKSNGGKVLDFKVNEWFAMEKTNRRECEWMSADEVDYDPPPETTGGPPSPLKGVGQTLNFFLFLSTFLFTTLKSGTNNKMSFWGCINTKKV